MEYGVAHHDAALVSGRMGKLVGARDIAGTEDVPLRRAESFVELEAPPVEGDADILETQAFQVHSPARGHEQGLCPDALRLPSL